MKQTENKLKYIICAILIVSLAIPIMAMPSFAQVTESRTNTWLYVGTGSGSRPIQIGQDVLIVAWTKDVVPDIGETSGAVSSPTGRSGWDGMKINVTTPSNETIILDMPRSDPVGANYVTYTPTELGVYTIQAIFPATWKNTTRTAQFFSAAVSAPDTFTVQRRSCSSMERISSA